MDTVLRVCNYDCLVKGSYDVFDCFNECSRCFNSASCWGNTTTPDAQYYGSESDFFCYETCYDGCGDYWPTTSLVCNCEGHGACVLSCPQNCAEGTLKTCNIGCLSELGDLYPCTEYCNTCVKDKQCWSDTDYGIQTDINCWAPCNSVCATNLGGASSLCNCEDHGDCFIGCIGNCDPG